MELGVKTLTANRRRQELRLLCLKIKRTNGEPTVFTTEIGITRTQDQKLLRRTDGKLKFLGSTRIKRAKAQSAFEPIYDWRALYTLG